jgi:hypothetical protein
MSNGQMKGLKASRAKQREHGACEEHFRLPSDGPPESVAQVLPLHRSSPVAGLLTSAGGVG